MKFAGRRGSSAGSTASSRSGMRVSSCSNITRSSRRASAWPRQKCAPNPNATCSLGSRSTSKRYGSSNLVSSRLADSYSSMHFWPCVQLLTHELGVVGDRAAHVLDRAHPAQHLLDRGRDLRRIVDEQLALVGVQQQLLHAAADDVAGRLVAADEDEQRLVQHVVGVEAVAVDLGVHEHAHEVVGRVLLPLRDRVRAELGVLRPWRASRRGTAPRWRCRSARSPCRRTSAAGRRGLRARRRACRRSAPSAAARRRRARSRTRPARTRWSMIASHLSRISLLAVAHPARREAPVHELAALPVLGIVHVDHHRDRTRVGTDAARVRERRRILRRAEHRGVAGQAPHVVRGVEVDGRVARASTCTSGAGRRRRTRRRAGRSRTGCSCAQFSRPGRARASRSASSNVGRPRSLGEIDVSSSRVTASGQSIPSADPVR